MGTIVPVLLKPGRRGHSVGRSYSCMSVLTFKLRNVISSFTGVFSGLDTLVDPWLGVANKGCAKTSFAEPWSGVADARSIKGASADSWWDVANEGSAKGFFAEEDCDMTGQREL